MKRFAAGRRARHAARRVAGVGVALVVALLAAAPRSGRASEPATPDLERMPVRYTAAPAGAPVGRPPSATNNAIGDLTHVVLALVVVVGLILVLRAVARRLSLVPPSAKAGRGVRLLSRTILSPKQQVLLLQVGRRIVVVGDGGSAGMRPLCEITDADEVAMLVGNARSADGPGPAGRSFRNLFGRAAEPFAQSVPDAAAGPTDGDPFGPPPPGDTATGMSPDVAGLLNKVRGVRQQFDR